MADAPRKYYLINDAQIAAARKIWPQVSEKTWTLVMKRGDEPLVLNKPAHKGVCFVTFAVPDKLVEGMHYRRDIDVLILVSGETPLTK